MITCRYTDRRGNQCTAEAVDPNGELLLCVRHLAAAIELIRTLADKHPQIAMLTRRAS